MKIIMDILKENLVDPIKIKKEQNEKKLKAIQQGKK